MMNRILAMMTLGVLAALPSWGRTVRDYTSASEGVPSLTVDSIDYRKDLTRIYGHLTGTPHTSARIDAVTLTSEGRLRECSDIDGVDFNRYFQWEDDGRIAIELDFQAMPPVREGMITIKTPRGEALTKIILPDRKKGQFGKSKRPDKKGKTGKR